MKLTELLIADIERDAEATRKVLERVPEGHDKWKPHDKSMELGMLVYMVAQ
jgi:DNA topoisomerase VI subunit B